MPAGEEFLVEALLNAVWIELSWPPTASLACVRNYDSLSKATSLCLDILGDGQSARKAVLSFFLEGIIKLISLPSLLLLSFFSFPL